MTELSPMCAAVTRALEQKARGTDADIAIELGIAAQGSMTQADKRFALAVWEAMEARWARENPRDPTSPFDEAYAAQCRARAEAFTAAMRSP